MHLAGVSEYRARDITEIFWDEKVSASTIATLNKKIYPKIERWRTRPLSGTYPYVYVDGIFLKRAWGARMKT
jgi:transposase-like protein